MCRLYGSQPYIDAYFKRLLVDLPTLADGVSHAVLDEGTREAVDRLLQVFTSSHNTRVHICAIDVLLRRVIRVCVSVCLVTCMH